MFGEVVSLIISVSGITVVGLLVLLNNPRSVSNRWFATFAAALVIWPIFNYLSLNTPYHLLFIKLVMVAATVIMSSFYFLAHVFPNETSLKLRKHKFALGYAIVTMLISLSPWLFTGVEFKDGNLTPQPGPAMPLFVGLLAYYLPAGLIHLYSKMKRAHQRVVRLQIKYLLLGSSLLFSAILVMNFVLPIAFENSSLVAYGPLLNLVFLAIIAYSMLYHSLFDIRFFVVRATAYIFSQLILSVMFIFPVVSVVLYILRIHVTNEQFVALVFSGVAVVGVYRYIWVYFDKLTSTIFFRNYYEPQEVLNKLSGALVTSIDVTDVEMSSQQILQSALRASTLSYWLQRDNDKKLLTSLEDAFKNQSDMVVLIEQIDTNASFARELRKRNIAVVAQLRTTSGSLGYMTFGYKQSGQVYDIQDKRLIAIAADDIAIALQNALHFEEIKQFNQTLEKSVHEATQELSRSNKKLMKLDAAKDEFVSMASHQLRTPLTSIKGYISMVLEGDAGAITEQQQKLLKEAFNSSERMVHLISDFLNVSRVQTGKFAIERKSVNLAELVQGEVDSIVSMAKTRDIQLFYKKPKHFPELQIDEDKIRQVVMNFIDNAIYYSRPQSTVVVRLKHDEKFATLEVHDHGIGVPKEAIEKLFTKFFRAENARRQRPDGTGVGLYLAKRVILGHKGELIMESTEGKGSVFGFRLPLNV